MLNDVLTMNSSVVFVWAVLIKFSSRFDKLLCKIYGTLGIVFIKLELICIYLSYFRHTHSPLNNYMNAPPPPCAGLVLDFAGKVFWNDLTAQPRSLLSASLESLLSNFIV